MDREERLAKKKREDQALNRVLWWFGGAVILEFFLLLLNRFYLNYNAAGAAAARGIFLFLKVFSWICLAAAVVFGVWWAVNKKRRAPAVFAGAGCVVSVVLFVCTFVTGMWKKVGVQFLYVGVPIVAVIALIYYLYQREFFLVSLQGGMSLFAMWSYYKMAFRHDINIWYVYGIFIAVAVLAVALTVLAVILRHNRGRLGKVRVLPKRASYVPLYITGGATLLSLALTLLLPRTYIALFAMVAWLFGAAVYYTVRLM